jgi:hypothetical protein
MDSVRAGPFGQLFRPDNWGLKLDVVMTSFSDFLLVAALLPSVGLNLEEPTIARQSHWPFHILRDFKQYPQGLQYSVMHCLDFITLGGHAAHFDALQATLMPPLLSSRAEVGRRRRVDRNWGRSPVGGLLPNPRNCDARWHRLLQLQSIKVSIMRNRLRAGMSR